MLFRSPAPAPAPNILAATAGGQVLPAQPQTNKPAGGETLWIHDDLDLDSLDLDEELAKLEAQEQQLSKQFLAIERAPQQRDGFLLAEPEERDPLDERWAEALLQDEPAKPAAPVDARSASPARPLTAREPEVNVRALDTHAALSAEPPLDLSISDRRTVTPEPEIEHIELHAERTPFSALTDDPDDEPPAAAKPARREPAVRDERLFELDDEPLQLDWQKPSKPWGRWLGWGLLNLLAAAALAGQYVMYHFDQLARQDQYRPWFEQICPAIGCQLPSKVDIAQVKSSNLVVRSHPEFSGALVVDAILYNRAPFSQPFPLLEMRFADINGQLLASRRFKPSEYLAGELAGNAEMPPQTPIHISLDILDPGPQAINYSLSFHSPE